MPGAYQGLTVPIKVQIGLRPNGHADHPDWEKLPLALAGGNTTNHMAGGWIYDQCGHQETDAQSPLGTQWGVLLVSEQFADEAVAQFPNVTQITDEAELRDFIETRCTCNMDEYRLHGEILQGLKLERDLIIDMKRPHSELVDINRRIAKALDSDDQTPGKTKNPGKTWSDIKKQRSITLSNRVTPIL